MTSLHFKNEKRLQNKKNNNKRNEILTETQNDIKRRNESTIFFLKK